MNDSIFEGTFLGNDDTAGTPADNDAEEIIDMPEIDDASSEDETSSGNILELLSRMREMMSDSDDEDDADESDMDSDDYHNKAVDRARRDKNARQRESAWKGLRNSPAMWTFLQTRSSTAPKPEICGPLLLITPF